MKMSKKARELYNKIPTETRPLSKKGKAYLDDNSTFTGFKDSDK